MQKCEHGRVHACMEIDMSMRIAQLGCGLKFSMSYEAGPEASCGRMRS